MLSRCPVYVVGIADVEPLPCVCGGDGLCVYVVGIADAEPLPCVCGG